MPGVIPVAVTTETIVRAVRESLGTDSVVLCVVAPHARARVAYASRVCVGWVGCGPYSGRSRVVFLPPSCPRRVSPFGRCCVVVGVVVCVGLLVPVSSEPLPVFHFRPINPVVCWGPTKTVTVLWRPRLEDGFPLRCFQRLPVPNVANQPCPGRDNWHTRGSSVPVLSY